MTATRAESLRLRIAEGDALFENLQDNAEDDLDVLREEGVQIRQFQLDCRPFVTDEEWAVLGGNPASSRTVPPEYKHTRTRGLLWHMLTVLHEIIRREEQ